MNLNKLFFSIILLAFASSSNAEDIPLGFERWGLNYIQENDPLSDTIKSAVQRGLLKYNGEPNESIVDAMQVSPNAKGWIFSISTNSVFGNGASIWLEDVLYSLQRCQKNGILPTSYSISMKSSGAHRGNILMSSKENVDQHQITKAIANCPIYSKEMIEILSEEIFFSNTHLISAGPYIIELTPNKDRIDLISPKMGNKNRVVLGHESSFEKGLSKVRSGEFMAYFTSVGQIQDRIKDDPTLDTIPCDSYNIISRKGLKIDCPDKFHLEEIAYAAP